MEGNDRGETAGQARAGQDRTSQGRAEQDRIEQGRARYEVKTRVGHKDKERLDKAGQNMACRTRNQRLG